MARGLDVAGCPVTPRKLGPFHVSALGLGCMSLSHAYGTPPADDVAAAVLLKALDLGYSGRIYD